MTKEKGYERILGKFKSIQSAFFTALSVLVLCAVIIVTAVSMRYTRSSIYENSVVYTRTIISQMTQNIDSYINYMDNIALMLSESEDVQYFLFSDDESTEYRKRLLSQYATVLNSREDIRNLGILCAGGKYLFNEGTQVLNPYLDLESQEWYQNAMNGEDDYGLTSSHVQHAIKGERPWVITLSRRIPNNLKNSSYSDGVFFIDLNYSAISELCDENSIGEKGYIFILDKD